MMTPFDGPHTELAWMFLQSLTEGADLDEGFSLLSDDFTYWSLYTRISFDKATLRQSVEWRKRTLDLTVELRSCFADGDTVVVEAQAFGTNTDGVEYDSPFACIFEIRDGLIVSMREYSDTRAQERALPKSPSGGY
ncbi:hypothetical protein A5712_09220 [Mycobacterium sp. E2327]|uniref:nuclear transport factor 2 family protein n=1 Tax=Mycobacterium sp. E2327 TaxID=1834132 RepID=UPI0007FDD4B7|nr:nuclear transport factor 2 family protein [Mycobacterium sp. E2327]OBI11688.1 hypothetical protein A5712_09220 [Mycobacterium sp. E2327]